MFFELGVCLFCMMGSLYDYMWVLVCRCDADPAALAKYVVALLRKEKPKAALKELCIDQLEVFLAKGVSTINIIISTPVPSQLHTRMAMQLVHIMPTLPLYNFTCQGWSIVIAGHD